jgi:diaminopimelate decarboxylase
MNDILRPTLYGAQHPMDIIPASDETQEYVVVGHNCESGDLLTPAPGDPETLAPRILPKAEVGDLLLIGGTGAYCASMAAHSYNGFPSAKEILL